MIQDFFCFGSLCASFTNSILFKCLWTIFDNIRKYDSIKVKRNQLDQFLLYNLIGITYQLFNIYERSFIWIIIYGSRYLPDILVNVYLPSFIYNRLFIWYKYHVVGFKGVYRNYHTQCLSMVMIICWANRGILFVLSQTY